MSKLLVKDYVCMYTPRCSLWRHTASTTYCCTRTDTFCRPCLK